jgi:hypothetical protein
MSIIDMIDGKYHKQYYEKYGTLPNHFDSLGRKPYDYQEKVLKEALEKGVTWQELTGQKHNDLM